MVSHAVVGNTLLIVNILLNESKYYSQDADMDTAQLSYWDYPGFTGTPVHVLSFLQFYSVRRLGRALPQSRTEHTDPP